MRYINIVSRCATIWRTDKLEGTELGDQHYSYILVVCRRPGISQDAISRRLFINKSNVTRSLSYLEEHGFVTRERDPEDRRQTRVYPTEKAIDILPRVREMIKGWNSYITEGFTEEEMEMSITTKRILILVVIIAVAFCLGRLAVRVVMNMLLGGTLFGGNFL